MPKPMPKPRTPETAELLRLFQTKRYTGQQTLVIDFLGNVSLLDDAKHIYFMHSDKHFLLLRPEDFKDQKTLQTRLDIFNQKVDAHWDRRLKKATDEFVSLNQQLLLLKGNNDKAILNNLKSLTRKNEKTCKKHLKLLKQNNLPGLKKALTDIADKRFKNKLKEKLAGESIESLAKKLPKATKKTDEDLKFIDSQALRALENKGTRPSLASALQSLDAIFCAKSTAKLMGTERSSLAGVGHANPKTHRLILTMDTAFHNESPSLATLGGLTSMPPVTDCIKTGNEKGVGIHVSTPFLRLLVEEAADYVGQVTKSKLNVGPDMMITSLSVATRLAKIANKVIGKQTLSKKEQAQWKKMEALADKLEEQSDGAPQGTMLMPLDNSKSSSMPTGHTIRLAAEGVQLNAKLVKKSVGLNCELPAGQGITQWTLTPDKPWSKPQKAWLYPWIARELALNAQSIRTSYQPSQQASEFLGKTLAWKVFFPGFIETFLPELHDVFQQRAEILNAQSPENGSCSAEQEDCIKSCAHVDIHQPTIRTPWTPNTVPMLPTDATAESTTFNATLSPAEALEQTAIHLAQNASGNIMLFKLGAYLFKNIRANVQNYFSATKETFLSDDDAAMRFQAMDEHLVYTTNRLSALKAKYPKKNWGEKTRELESCCRRLRLLDRNNPTEEKFTPLEERIGNLQRGLLPVAKGKKSTHRQAACPSEPYKTSSSAVFFAEVPKALAPTNSSQLLEVR